MLLFALQKGLLLAASETAEWHNDTKKNHLRFEHHQCCDDENII